MTDIYPTPLLWSAPRTGYLPGEEIERSVYGPEGVLLGRFTFTIRHSPGSGFAGQVYQAVPRPPGPFPPFVALKVLRPRSGWKLWVRDTLFRLCFQASFAPRLREEAVRSGLGWQAFLRVATRLEFGTSNAVARPYGYYWDADLSSFAEVHEWVDGREALSEPDDQILARWLHRPDALPPENEMARKKEFMDALATLCRRLGSFGLARQYDWWTLVAQSNVLTCTPSAWTDEDAPGHNPSRAGVPVYAPGGDFTAVDTRPGLAIPFFLPLSPAHVRIIWEGLRRGVLVHYDEVDFGKLVLYLKSHPGLDVLLPAVETLANVDTAYRALLPNLWHNHLHFFTDPDLRLRTRRALAADWKGLGQVDLATAETLPMRPILFYSLAFLGLLPFTGSFLARLSGNASYRAHLHAVITSSAYRLAVLAAWKARDLPTWECEGRISPAHAALLARLPASFLAEKILLAWLPPGLHRALVEPAVLRCQLARLIRQPLDLLLSQNTRQAWLENILRFQAVRGMLSPDLLRIHLDQLAEPRMQGYIRDLGFTAGMDLFSRLVYLGLSIYGLSTGDFLPLGLAALGPIPPSGPLRAIYILVRLPADLVDARRWGQSMRRVLEARLVALGIAPWRWIGNLFPLVEISAFYTRLSFLLAEYFISRAASIIPVLGGEGRLLQHGIFQAFYNLPISLRYELKRKKQDKS